MRENLEKIGAEERHTFTGVFERTGFKSGYKGPVKTLLLLNVQNEEGIVVAEHLWFNYTLGFSKLELKKGDIVKFDGRIEQYERGYYGRRENVSVPYSIDYKISRPTKIEKIGSSSDVSN